MRRPLSVLLGVALAGALVAGCGGGDDRSVSIGQVDDTTTTLAPANAALPCTDDALRVGYAQTYGSEPAGSISPLRCLAGWALATYSNAVEAPTFVLFHAEAGTWVAKSQGVAHVCAGQGVPPNIAPQIGCDT